MNTEPKCQRKTAAHLSLVPTRGAILQRACACGQHTVAGGQCSGCKDKLQRSAVGPSGTNVAPPIVNQVLRSPGRPLDSATRAFMEPRFGHDFSRVRVHTDSKASESAFAVNSLAYTVGSNLVFGAGRYAPATSAGRHLLAHELAHVVQQESSSVPSGPLEIGGQDHYESSADIAAREVVSAEGPVHSAKGAAASKGLVRRSSPVVQRFTFGASPPAGHVVVPADHRTRVTEAMNIITKLTKDKACQKFFKEKCTAGLGAAELETAIKDAEVYHNPVESQEFGVSDARTVAADPRKISYNLTAFRIGRWELASTLLHEMFHTCILGAIPNEEVTAETAVEVCHLFTPFILEVSPKSASVGSTVTIRGFEFGPAQTANHHVTFNGVDAGTADSWVLSNVDSMVRIKIKVPAGATTGPVVVTNHGVPSNQVNFTVT